MNKRKIIIVLAGVGILAASILLSGMLTKEGQEKPKEFEMLTSVQLKKMTPTTIVRTIPITGRLIPKQSVLLYAEVGGRATFGSKPFKEGVSFNKGEILLSVNSDELRSSLSAKRSNFQSLLASVIPDLKLDFVDASTEWEEYLFKIDTDQKLPPLPEVEDRKLKHYSGSFSWVAYQCRTRRIISSKDRSAIGNHNQRWSIRNRSRCELHRSRLHESRHQFYHGGHQYR